MLDPFKVKPFADQPRKRFRGIPQLTKSIRLVGQVTPIVVTPMDAAEQNGFVAELVDGERRLQACRTGNMKIKAALEGKVNAAERFALSIAANFCRQEHDCIEVAEAVKRLKDAGRSVEDIGGIFGKSTCWVYQHLSLLSLHDEVIESLKVEGDEQKLSKTQRRRRGRMTRSVALLLVPLDAKLQAKAARHITAKKLSMAGARSYVVALASGSGKTVGHEGSPRKNLEVLWNAMDTFRHRLDRYVDLSHAQLRSIFETAKGREATVLAGQMDSAAETLKMLAKSLRKAAEL
jgi:ParB/RepB/Spo0J family partition protein